ncbi:MAG: S49 family peptidase [gamma proteobacterium symbiont of Ctena orbiculata]|uniref:S49 family peptidase n=1 Tax=Candidatus Thiodiazotropha taylori TaxID=2792791 RepID=A0A944QUX0_9GAMM|nr:S49 family peptidase [Candidatus Thiodiazotropha taylori]PUB81144.1 MAG: S49 family peptidase [gamma proteobacterium symbiont of Ctena orbiculata]MBT2990587.1 S49 family peptidase [Candidatus Thiodiazotropha taylori]MBT2998118.1 S49 family peptidase [Candidatus Thiodiazotropha taylori]MBT3002417.1 S49 family peptidase [Candidatus Thiodiazotropha taylori]
MSETNNGDHRSQSEPSRWERDLLNQMVMATVAENRRSRRWGIFFKLLTFGYLFLLLGVFLWGDKMQVAKSVVKEHTALIEVKGLISSETKASADNIVTGLRDAFEDKKTKGVILRMNTPGGSPVQSRYINREISRLREKYPKIPVYAVVADVCASGGYYIAVAADKIYADEGSLVGSIGVLINGFGFVDGMEELGIERRLLTAGDNKGILDPFSPLKDGDKQHIQQMLDQLHLQFIETVKEGRGDRLKIADYPELFSGLFWNGEEAKEMGLIDDFGSSSYVAREIIGAEEIVDFTPKEDVWERLARNIGAGAAEVLATFSGLGLGPNLR